MGAPKQKWTQDEESALKAGVVKHGAGKWRTILKDPEFSGVLYLRSNVDLKDKWRNMSVMANGWGSRDKARVALRRIQYVPKHEENPTSSVDVQSDEDTTEVGPLAVTPSSGDMQTNQSAGSKKSIVRLDSLVTEAIANLKEVGGSNKTAIASYIEEQYCAPPDFKRILSAKLKFMTTVGKLNKVKRKYRIASTPALDKNQASSSLQFEGHQMDSPDFDFENDEQFQLMKAQIEVELAEMRKMSPKDAASAAAKAVAEAERALAEAEEAEREAEAAEANAEAAQAFADAAMKDLKEKQAQRMKNSSQTARP